MTKQAPDSDDRFELTDDGKLIDTEPDDQEFSLEFEDDGG